jgi:hypothetical protein
MHLVFAGPMPSRTTVRRRRFRRPIFAAIEAASDVLSRHGFTVVRAGHGSRRVGTYTPATEAEQA